MTNEGFFHRFRNGGIFRVVTGYDLYAALFISVILFYILGSDITGYQLDEFIRNSTTLSGSLTAVIITGTAILVSLTDSDFLLLLKRNNLYSNLMFNFEYTTLLSIFVSVFGVVLQSYNYTYIELYIFIFFFLYLIFAVSRLVSQIVSFGDRRGDLELVKRLETETDTLQETDFTDQNGDSLSEGEIDEEAPHEQLETEDDFSK